MRTRHLDTPGMTMTIHGDGSVNVSWMSGGVPTREEVHAELLAAIERAKRAAAKAVDFTIALEASDYGEKK